MVISRPSRSILWSPVTAIPCPAVECAAFDERDIDAGNGCSGEAGHLIDLFGKAVSVIGITGQRHGTEDKLTALAALVGGGDGRLAAELTAGARLALARSRAVDTAHFGRVHGVE